MQGANTNYFPNSNIFDLNKSTKPVPTPSFSCAEVYALADWKI